MEDYIKIKKLKEDFLYEVNARNASYGIWNPERNSFFISRIKFDINFLFEEIHYDADEHYGTIRPLKEIELSPFKCKDNQIQSIKSERTNKEYLGYPNEKDILEYLNKFEGRK